MQNHNKSYNDVTIHAPTKIIKNKKKETLPFFRTGSFTSSLRIVYNAPTARFSFIDATKKSAIKLCTSEGAAARARYNCEFRLLMMIMAPRVT